MATNKAKRDLARELLVKAGDIVEFWYENPIEGMTGQKAAEILGKWLAHLPGDVWDTRLIEPTKRPRR